MLRHTCRIERRTAAHVARELGYANLTTNYFFRRDSIVCVCVCVCCVCVCVCVRACVYSYLLYMCEKTAEKVCAMAHGCLPGIFDRMAFASDRTAQ